MCCRQSCPGASAAAQTGTEGAGCDVMGLGEASEPGGTSHWSAPLRCPAHAGRSFQKADLGCCLAEKATGCYQTQGCCIMFAFRIGQERREQLSCPPCLCQPRDRGGWSCTEVAASTRTSVPREISAAQAAPHRGECQEHRQNGSTGLGHQARRDSAPHTTAR